MALFTAAAMQVLFTSERAMAQSGLARFKVWIDPADFWFGSEVNQFNPTIALSPSAVWAGDYNIYQRLQISH